MSLDTTKAQEWLKGAGDQAAPLGSPVFTAPSAMTTSDQLWQRARLKSTKGTLEGLKEGGLLQAVPFGKELSRAPIVREIEFLSRATIDEKELDKAIEAVRAGTGSQEQFNLIVEDMVQRSRPGSTGYYAMQGLKSITSFGLEIAATSGIAALGRGVGARALAKIGVSEGLVGRMAVAGAGEAARFAAIDAGKYGLDWLFTDEDEEAWSASDLEAFRRAMPEFELDATDDGRLQLVLTELGSTITDKKWEARTSGYIELIAERMGPTLGAAFRKLPLGGKIMALEQDLFRWLRGKGYAKNLDELAALVGRKAELQGPLEEWFEERAGAALRGLTPGMEETLGEVVPGSFEEGFGEFIAILAPGTARAVAGRAFGQSAEELREVIEDAKAGSVLHELAQAERAKAEGQTPAGETDRVAAEGIARMQAQLERDADPSDSPVELVDVAEEDQPLAGQIEAVAEASGVDIRWFSTDSGEASPYPAVQAGEGVVLMDTALLQDEALVRKILLHELIHDIGSKSQETLDELIADLREFDPQGLAKAAAAIQKDRGGDISRGLRLEEGAARRAEEVDALVFYLQSKEGASWLEQLEKAEDRGPLKRLVDMIRDLLARVGLGKGSPEAQAMASLSDALGGPVTTSDLNAARSIRAALAKALESELGAEMVILPPSKRPSVRRPEEGPPPEAAAPEKGPPPKAAVPEEGPPPEAAAPEKGPPPEAAVPEEEEEGIPALSARATRYQSAPEGDQLETLELAGGRSIPVTYRVVEADDVLPTHDAREGFRPNEGADINERPYQDPTEGKASRATVEKIADKPKPKLIFTDTASPVDGPPIVTPEGVVLGGNARTMAMQLAYSRGGKQAAAFRRAARAFAKRVGADPAGIKNPVIVREVPADQVGARGELSRELNAPLTTARTAIADAVSRGAKIDAKAAVRVSKLLGDETLGTAFNDAKKTQALLGELVRIGAFTDADVTSMLEDRGLLTKSGRDTVEQALLGAAMPDVRRIAEMAPLGRQKIIRSLPSLIRIRSKWGEFTRHLGNMADGARTLRESRLPLEDVLGQQSIVPEAWKDDQVAVDLLRVFSEVGQKQWASRMRALAEQITDQTSGQSGMFADVVASSPEAAVRLVTDPEARFAVRRRTNTPEFRRWFGNSKVVDENGKPLVVYHSTHAEFTEADPTRGVSSLGFHVGTAEQAQATQETAGTKADVDARRPMEGQRIMPLYVSLQSPLRMEDKGPWYSFAVVERLASEHGIQDPTPLPENARELAGKDAAHLSITWDGYSEARKKYEVVRRARLLEWMEAHPEASRDAVQDAGVQAANAYVRELIQSAGYDGIVYANKFEGEGDSWIAFRPEQIKSATGNRGTFDPESPDIRFAVARPDTPEFKRWFKDSKVVDDEDRPLVVYHGTADSWTVPNLSKLGTSTNAHFSTLGFFFTPSRDSADFYRQWAVGMGEEGGDVMEVYMALQNPRELTYAEASALPSKAAATALREQAQSEGYDGFVLVDEAGVGEQPKEYIAFEPTQIKSATGNRGTFDPESPDIRFSVSAREFERGVNPLPAPEGAEVRVRKKLKRKGKVGRQRNKRQTIKLRGGRRFTLGRINVRDWVRRVEDTLTDEELERAKNWYPDARNFFAETGDQWPNFVTAWLIANKNVDVTGATLNALRGREHVMSPPTTLGSEASPKAGLSEDAMGTFWRWARGDEGVTLEGLDVGQKLFDFIDSALGKRTRSWMGDDARAGDPFVVDVHSARDMGYLDEALYNWLEKEGAPSDVLEQLEVEIKGAPSETQYERAAELGNRIADYLNKTNYRGGGWDAAAVQAVGWITMQKVTGRALGFPDLTLPRMTRTVTAAAMFGEGAPLAEQFPEFADLPYEGQLRVTQRLVDKALEVANPLVGDLPVLSITYGGGGFLEYPVEPSAAIRVSGSPEGVDSLGQAMAYLLQQTAVRSEKPLALTKSGGLPSKANAWFVDIQSPELAQDEDARQRFWKALMVRTDAVKGYHPTNRGVLIGVDTSGEYAEKQFQGLKKGLPKLESLIDNEVNAALIDAGISADVDVMPGEVQVTHNDWTTDKEGRGHLQGLGARWGPEIQRELRGSGRRSVEAELREALEAEAEAEVTDRFAGAAYHGSPHRFDKFSTDKIGTGEGSQVYGWGLYFASKKEVAEYYKHALGRLAHEPTVKIAGEVVDEVWAREEGRLNVWEAILDATEGGDTGKRVVEMADETVRENARLYSAPVYAQDLEWWEANRDSITVGWGGRGYQVSLAPSEDEYLLWDRPLSEQSEKVREALEQVRPGFQEEERAYRERYPHSPIGERTGSNIYGDVSRREGSDRAASQALLAAGVRGVKYLDGTSRGKGEGSYNYVIFDEADVEITDRFAVARQDQLGFFSGVEKAALDLASHSPQKSYHKAQVRPRLKKYGAKDEELDWMLLDEWLRGLPKGHKITDDELLEFVRENAVVVEEKVLGEPRSKKIALSEEERRAELESLPMEELIRESGLEWESSGDLDQDREDLIDGIIEDQNLGYSGRGIDPSGEVDLTSPTLFNTSNLVLPGGEGHRELLLTLPVRLPSDDQIAFPSFEEWSSEWLTGEARQDAEWARMVYQKAREEAGKEERARLQNTRYQSPHFPGTPNLLVSIRFNERTDADGARVLFIEEIQSDWHQTGREKGYQKGPDTRTLEKLSREELMTIARTNDPNGVWDDEASIAEFGEPVSRETLLEVIRGWEREDPGFNVEQFLRARASTGGVPDAPFKTSWPTLAMKRMVRWAAENGFDKIAWTTGAQQVDRYETELRQAVDAIEWKPSEGSGHGTSVTFLKGGSVLHPLPTARDRVPHSLTVDERGIVTDGQVPWMGHPLEEVVGKDIARQILAEDSGTVEGEGLTIGGKGFTEFYDKRLADTANKIGKKFGAKVGRTQIAERKYEPFTSEGVRVDDPFMDESGRFEVDPQDHYGITPKLLSEAVSVHSLPITPQMRESVMEHGMPRFAARRRPGQRFKRTFSFDLPDEGLSDLWRRRIQDEFIRIQRLEGALGNVSVDDSVYETVSAASSKMRGAINQLRRDFVEPIYDEIRAIVRAGGTAKEAADYLLARHAPSRNKVIAARALADAKAEAQKRAEAKAVRAMKRGQAKGLTYEELLAEFVKNEPLGEVRFQDVEKDPGSGIPTSEALETVKKAESGKSAAHFKGLGKLVDRMNTESLRRRLKAGLLSQEQFDAYLSQWDHYVPFKTDTDLSPYVTGGGFSVSGSEFHRAGGRETVPDSPLQFAIQQAYQAIERAEKNRAGRDFYGLLKRHSRLVEFSEDQPEDYVPPDQLEEGQLAFKKNGKQIIISLPDKLLARAIGRVGRVRLPAYMRALNKAVRLFVATRTSLSPDFLARNFFRDIFTASIHISSEQGEDLARRARKGVFKAIAAGYQIRRGKVDRRKGYHKDYLEYEESGGLIGWYYTPTIDELEGEVNDLAKDVSPTLGRRATSPVRELLAWTDDANHAIENGIRLSLFRELRKDGFSAKEAAKIARNVTVDFTKKGEWSSVTNTLFVFSNAGIQGIRKNLAVLRTSRGKKFAAGLVASGFAGAVTNMLVGGEDDDGELLYLKIPDHIRDSHLCIIHPNGDTPIPGGKGHYFKLPLGYGWSSFWALGSRIAEVASGRVSVLEASAGLVRAIGDSWNPIGVAPDIWQFLSPTLTDPLVQHATNTSWAGNPIMPEHPGYGLEIPDSQRHFKSVSKGSEWIAKWLNTVTGGDEVEGGLVDVSPETFDHFFEFLTGSAGAAAQRTVDIPLKLANGEIPKISEIPVLRTFVGTPSEWFVSKTYYANRDNIERLKKRVDLYQERGENKKANEMVQNNQKLWGLRNTFKSTDKRIRELRKTARALPEKDQAPYLERIDKLQRRFNRLVGDG